MVDIDKAHRKSAAQIKDEKFQQKHIERYQAAIKRKGVQGAISLYLSAVSNLRNYQKILGNKNTIIERKDKKIESLRRQVDELASKLEAVKHGKQQEEV